MRIKFTSSGFCSSVGNFAPGDIAIVSDDIGQHLIRDAQCAVSAEVVVVAEPVAVPVADPKPSRARK